KLTKIEYLATLHFQVIYTLSGLYRRRGAVIFPDFEEGIVIDTCVTYRSSSETARCKIKIQLLRFYIFEFGFPIVVLVVVLIQKEVKIWRNCMYSDTRLCF